MNFRMLAVLAAALGLAGPVAAAPQVPPPLVDHHQHLLSPAIQDLDFVKPLPEIVVPDDVGRLLRAHEAGWQDKAAIAPLFTADAVVLSDQNPGWLIGRDKAADYYGGRFARPYRMLPVAFSADGAGAHLAGYYVRGEGADMRYLGYFSLDLVKDAAGSWRIKAEIPRYPGPAPEPTVDGAQMVALLDAAGIKRAVLLGEGYFFAETMSGGPDEYEKVKAENDWAFAQAARFPDRLVAVCGVDPLRDYAIAELERCARAHRTKALKLHFDSAKLEMTNPEHAAKAARLFAAADRLGVSLIVHTQSGRSYGPAQARAIIETLLPAAPNVTVHICHLWGGGGFTDEAAGALQVFADAAQRRDRRMKNVRFDIAQVAMATRTPETAKLVTQRMREIGMDKMLYGSDGPSWEGVDPAEHWAEFKKTLPLTPQELRIIATNVAPYLR